MEVIGSEFFCNLASIHFNRLINEFDGDYTKLPQLMYDAFYAGGLIAAPLLSHVFTDEQFQYSREIDPIVLVSFTELFEFFAWLFGPRWCEWWLAGDFSGDDWIYKGRPDEWLVETTEEDKVHLNNIYQTLGKIPWYVSAEDKEDAHRYIYEFLTSKETQIDLGFVFRNTERVLLKYWKTAVFDSVQTYCTEHNLPIPNRCTGLKPEGTGTLLTGHSAGWHPPYAKYYIRRITMDPKTAVAKACFSYGYEVVPGQSDFDENGNLLNDPFDPRVTTWLVEVPICVDTLPEWFDSSDLTALSQYKFWMQVQQHYTTHNTSSTILLKKEEVPVLAAQIYADIYNNRPYMSTALLDRGEGTFPRQPYEKCTKEEYERRIKKIKFDEDFYELVLIFDHSNDAYSGPMGCDSDFCEMK